MTPYRFTKAPWDAYLDLLAGGASRDVLEAMSYLTFDLQSEHSIQPANLAGWGGTGATVTDIARALKRMADELPDVVSWDGSICYMRTSAINEAESL